MISKRAVNSTSGFRKKRASISLPVNSSYRKSVLPSGLRVVTESIPHVRSVSVGVWVDTGSRDEDARTNGISHFIEHMVFKGTARRTAREISRSIESVGGYMNAFTSKEHTCFYARVLDDHTELAVDVLSDLVQNPLFPARELEKEKGVVIEELRNAEDDPDDIIHDYFEKSLYGSHSMGFPVIGTEKNLRSFTRDDLINFRSRHYRPSRMVVAAAGNVVHDEIVSLVEESLGKRGATGTVSVRKRPTAVRKEVIVVERPIQQAHICMGTKTFSIRNKNRYPLLVLNTLLGDGMSSRLFQNIRERYGFAYSVYSFVNMLSDTGSFGTYIGTDKTHVDASIELIFKEFTKLKEKPVSRAELKRTKEQLKGSMMLSLESIANRMMRLGSSELYFHELSPLDTITRQIDAVTADDVQRLAQLLFREERFSQVIFQPQGTTERKSSGAASRAAASR